MREHLNYDDPLCFRQNVMLEQFVALNRTGLQRVQFRYRALQNIHKRTISLFCKQTVYRQQHSNDSGNAGDCNAAKVQVALDQRIA